MQKAYFTADQPVKSAAVNLPIFRWATSPAELIATEKGSPPAMLPNCRAHCVACPWGGWKISR